ncbi:hypothetical protein HGP28_09610 [Vibrio sp. SM6]|uniref:KfrA N-terminal DNA-binding domain-containing protein n=1 Tax=Vibrio agarilyticus TaxID=2726741 RepID=A0A7X8TQR5_9VIBR|nr:hypothetical protein [Vibrio agarilyticus]NLS13145.1 hypothetical protein [Vibrio agarilyticus]
MKTQNVTQELETVLAQLGQQGKTPTVALVKARLTTAVPIPAIIAAIKSWKNMQHVPKIEVAAATSTEAERITTLETQVAQLLERVSQLEQQLNEQMK